MSENGNKPAFPIPADKFNFETAAGLTKREHFAGLMLQALIANPARYEYIAGLVKGSKFTHTPGISQEEASAKNAHKAVMLADALLAELESK
jgi:hypothetical protein